MAHRLATLVRTARSSPLCRVDQLPLHHHHARLFSATALVSARQKGGAASSSSSAPAPVVDERRRVSLYEEDAYEPFEDDSEIIDSPSGGHLLLQAQREVLHYLRLIELEMPKLVAYRKEFVPPGPDRPLVVRSVHYQSETHPVARKRVITVPVDLLPLKGDTAKHKFKLLAGPRWTPEPPKDAGVGATEVEQYGKNGFIKISCEDFPYPGLNLKWTSDVLDKLVKEANDTKDTFSDVPLDMRHVIAKAKKAKDGKHIRDRIYTRPSIRDFPKEWLPSEQRV